MAEKRRIRNLRRTQKQREKAEDRARKKAQDPDEARAHERRAEKAAYLSDKLDEQASSEE